MLQCTPPSTIKKRYKNSSLLPEELNILNHYKPPLILQIDFLLLPANNTLQKHYEILTSYKICPVNSSTYILLLM
jgi:hypothetical protein